MNRKLFAALTVACLFAGAGLYAQKIKLDPATVKKNYGTKLVVEPMDSGVKITKNTIVLAPEKEGTTYTLTGYFRGKVVNKTKNTVVRLNGAYLENSGGEPALYGELKTEVSTAANTENYIVSFGKNKAGAKNGALHSRKALELGGSGTLFVVGMSAHGAKGGGVKLKGSGTIYLQGTQNGAALSCGHLVVEEGKKLTAYFINSKNGIKADGTINIASGTFYFYNDGTALKTATKKDSPQEEHGITLSGGTFYSAGNVRLYATEENAYNANGAKIIEEQ